MSQNYKEIMIDKIKDLEYPLDNKEVSDFLKKMKILFFSSRMEHSIKYKLDIVCNEKNIKWRTGRPSKLNEKRKNQTIRLSIKEKEILNLEHKKHLKELNINSKIYPFSQFLRDKLFKKTPIKESFEVAKLVYEFNKIGNNVNQIAKKLNSYNDNYTGQLSYKIDKDYNDLQDIFQKLITSIQNNDS